MRSHVQIAQYWNDPLTLSVSFSVLKYTAKKIYGEWKKNKYDKCSSLNKIQLRRSTVFRTHDFHCFTIHIKHKKSLLDWSRDFLQNSWPHIYIGLKGATGSRYKWIMSNMWIDEWKHDFSIMTIPIHLQLSQIMQNYNRRKLDFLATPLLEKRFAQQTLFLEPL